jgi:hypothetical protein
LQKKLQVIRKGRGCLKSAVICHPERSEGSNWLTINNKIASRRAYPE